MAEQVTSHGDGVFITAVVLLVAVMLFVMGFAGLGSPGYSPFAILLLLGAGGATYFALRGAGEFGMKEAGSTLFIAGLALVGAFAFMLVFARGPLLSSIAAAVVIVCAAPIIGLAVRSRTRAKAGLQEGSASS